MDEYLSVYGADVWRLRRKLCPKKEDAEDLYQETFCRAFLKIDTYRLEEDFRQWIFAIYYNLFKDNYRKYKNLKEYDFANNEEKSLIMDSISQDFSWDEKTYDIKLAVDSLEIDLKAVVVLFYFNDYDIKDICQILKTTEPIVKNRLFKARKVLAERLGDYYET